MITEKITPDVYAMANNYAVDIADGDTKAWFDVRDAIAKAIKADRDERDAALRWIYENGFTHSSLCPDYVVEAFDKSYDQYRESLK